ncbi:uncharacterized protein [Euwallacea similis]|uniref:uncharacterized protein n=1 Tax=Euwallacea similis TaxID=1736056 RepID=UPI0034509A90
MARAEPDSQSQPFENPMFREIYKNTWLKKISTSNSKKKRERLWVVFCVHDDTDPYLETYVDEKLAVFHKPEWFISLSGVQHISPTICAHEQEYEFVLTFPSEVIRFSALTWDQMVDWVESLKSKLSELRILSPRENVYTKLPEKTAIPLLPTRDPNSPLPPPPPVPPEILPGVEHTSREITTSRQRESVPYERRRSDSQSSTTPRSLNVINEPQNARSSSNHVFNFEPLAHTLESSSSPNHQPSNNLHYEHLFQPGPSNTSNSTRQLSRTELNVNSITNRLLERSASCSPRILQPAPQPYKTLREQQVLMLEKEMKHPTGVKLQLRKKDCISSIGFVDAFDGVWICGWKQKEHPTLYNALHIGDRLLNIDGITIKSAAEAYRMLQSHYCGLYVNIVLRRLPQGKVFVIHRDTEGQPLGIIQENNTAVIESIKPNSLAARYGLTSKTKSCDGMSFTNWVLTEINGRPLNLFFKKNQVRDRLNCVGRDISVLVQPLDLIKQLKKQMRSLKNYKDYLLQ